jgi:hypothetical protein
MSHLDSSKPQCHLEDTGGSRDTHGSYTRTIDLHRSDTHALPFLSETRCDNGDVRNVVREASFGGTPYRVSSVAPGILARARTRVQVQAKYLYGTYVAAPPGHRFGKKAVSFGCRRGFLNTKAPPTRL